MPLNYFPKTDSISSCANFIAIFHYSFYGASVMQELQLRGGQPEGKPLEAGGRRDDTVHNKSSKFYGRVCVALAAAGLFGSLYHLSNWQNSVQATSLDVRTGNLACFNASQLTNITGVPVPNESDVYCTYPDQNIPGQMAELVAVGIVGVIEQAGTILYHGAKNTLACINAGLTWRQYRDETVCVRMDPATCESLGGYATSGGSVCIPAINPEDFASKCCTRDLADLCKWRS